MYISIILYYSTNNLSDLQVLKAGLLPIIEYFAHFHSLNSKLNVWVYSESLFIDTVVK